MSWQDPIVIIVCVVAGALLLTMWAAMLLPHIPVKTVKQMVVGYKAPPILVAAVRRLITALGSAVAASLLAWLTQFEAGELAAVAAGAAGVIEVGWGLLDQALKAGQNAYDPKPVAGGGSPDLAKP